MDKHRRHRLWVIWVWIVVGFFLFPLTPPISQNVTFQENVLSQFNETPAFLRVKSETAKVTVPNLYPLIPSLMNDDVPDPGFALLYVIFVIYLFSKLRELIKKQILAPLKYTSAYVSSAHSIL